MVKIKIKAGTHKINDTCNITVADDIYWIDRRWLGKIVSEVISRILEFFSDVEFRLAHYDPFPCGQCGRPLCHFLDREYELRWTVLNLTSEEIDRLHDLYLDKYIMLPLHKRFKEMNNNG